MDITRIALGGFNSYLLREGEDFLLVDTGMPSGRKRLMDALAKAGCAPDKIKLVVLTHGDHDHAGNCAYLHSRFGIETAMHAADTEMVTTGDMTTGRKEKPDRMTPFFKLMSRFSPDMHFETFSPHILLGEGDCLEAFGFKARIVNIPGHSEGSIAVVTPAGDAVCGDLFCNFTRPALHMLIDDMEKAKQSVMKLKGLGVVTVYPGHGRPFKLADFKARE